MARREKVMVMRIVLSMDAREGIQQVITDEWIK